MDDQETVERIGEGVGRVRLMNALWLLFIAIPVLAIIGLVLFGVYLCYTQPPPTF